MSKTFRPDTRGRRILAKLTSLMMVLCLVGCLESPPSADENINNSNNTNNSSGSNNIDEGGCDCDAVEESDAACRSFCSDSCDCTGAEICVEISGVDRCVDTADLCRPCDTRSDCPTTMACVDLGVQGSRCMLRSVLGCPDFVRFPERKTSAITDRQVEVCMNDISVTTCDGLRGVRTGCTANMFCESGACFDDACTLFCNSVADCLPNYSMCESVPGQDKSVCIE